MDPAEILDQLLTAAKRAGADAADALISRGQSVALSYRLSEVEKLERAEDSDLGLRVFIGKRQAIVSSSDAAPATLALMVERAMAMARLAPEDPYCGLAAVEDLAISPPLLDSFDPIEPSADTLIERARSAEEAARAIKGVTNSEGAEASWGFSEIALAASNGFRGQHQITRHSLSVSVLAGTGTEMERDYDYATTVYGADLPSPATIGTRAGERAVRRLGPKKVATAKIPIVFDQRLSGGFLRTLAGAISGPSIARRTSFLKDSLGKAIFPATITIIDDPYRPRGLRSRPFDGEGLAPVRRNLIENGVLTSWLLDLRSARQLGLASTGHASRGTSSPPSPSPNNLWLEPGPITVAELIDDIKEGLLVTDLMGMGVNGVTGDYSQGAAGFWIERGQIAYPVSEITIAGHLLEMFARLTPANDLEFRTGIDAPSLRIDGMTIAGV